MERYVILARSVTYAQRMQKLLGQAGIPCQISRAPRDLTDLGCAYILGLEGKDLPRAVYLLDREGLGPLRVFQTLGGSYQEVRIP